MLTGTPLDILLPKGLPENASVLILSNALMITARNRFVGCLQDCLSPAHPIIGPGMKWPDDGPEPIFMGDILVSAQLVPVPPTGSTWIDRAARKGYRRILYGTWDDAKRTPEFNSAPIIVEVLPPAAKSKLVAYLKVDRNDLDGGAALGLTVGFDGTKTPLPAPSVWELLDYDEFD